MTADGVELAKQIGCEKKQIIVGYRNDETFLKTEFEQNGEVYISTEDGSAGTKGNVMDAIRENGLEADIIYACGPTPMLRANQKLCGGKRGSNAIFRWKSAWHAVSEHVLHVYARRKKKIITVMCITKESVKTIREYSDLPITSNLLDAAINSGTGIDYFKLSKEFDFVTWDNYIEFQWGKAKPETVSRDHALLRSYKKKPFWVMEQQSGPCGWSKMGPTPTPGKLRLWTYQSVANGADTVVYFRWRACPFGTEELWHGILNHDGNQTEDMLRFPRWEQKWKN